MDLLIRSFAIVRDISEPFDAGKFVEITVAVDNPAHKWKFPWPASDADRFKIGDTCCATLERLVN